VVDERKASGLLVVVPGLLTANGMLEVPDALADALPSWGRRPAPKIRTTITRIRSNSGTPRPNMGF